MKKKTVSGMMLTLLLTSMLTLAFDIQPVEASETIYIWADGSVDPPTAPISTVDNVSYTFTANINEPIVVERDNIVVDGASYTVQGTGGGTGIDLSGRTNVTVKNVKIAVFFYGISLSHSSNNSISGNSIANNMEGIVLEESSNNSISGNNVTANNWDGISLGWFSDNNTISGNNVTDNGVGIYLYYSSYNVLRNNSMVGNRVHFRVVSLFLSGSINDVDVSNTVDGKPVYYWVNKHYATVPNDAGFVVLVNSTNIRVEGFNNLEGIALDHTINTTITQNNITSDISLGPSSNYNSISGNNVTGSIDLQLSNNNTMLENDISEGIYLARSSYNTISGNNITGGIGLVDVSYNNTMSRNNVIGGIWMYSDLRNNSISENNITGGVSFYQNGEYNTISNNNVTGGIGLVRWSSNNTISGNNITSGGIVLQWATSDNIISENVISNSEQYGILLSAEGEPLVNNKIIGNKITNSMSDGIYLGGCINTTLSGNYISNNGGSGIILYHYHFFSEMPASDSNSISGNNIAGNAEDGILLYGSSSNTIFGNNVTNNDSGIVLNWTADYYPHTPFYSENNIITGNDIRANNQYGIQLFNSSDNLIYHNNFVDNADQVYSENSANIWDDGYPSGGSYWSDYVTVDDYSGINQDEPGSDGIVDEPYIIDDDNRDRYPLVNPWTPVISATINIDPDTLNFYSKGKWITCYIELPEGYNVSDIDIYSVKLNDTFPVSLLPNPPVPVPIEIGDYDNDTIPDLMVKFNRTEVASWVYDDLGIHYGNVTLTITGEVDGTPLEGTDTVKVLFPGDADDDGDVDSNDIYIISRCNGMSIDNPSYNPLADFNEDGYINSEDLYILSENYGKTAV